jgi:hypothetical protein
MQMLEKRRREREKVETRDPVQEKTLRQCPPVFLVRSCVRADAATWYALEGGRLCLRIKGYKNEGEREDGRTRDRMTNKINKTGGE